jgi:SAM-dependent methyltransferase
MEASSEFDQYAREYDRALAQGLSASGEDKTYFAAKRVQWLASRMGELGEHPARLLDYGCGTGSSTALFFEHLKVHEVTGIDPSTASRAVARSANAGSRARFLPLDDYCPEATFDIAFCNGVFHHIPPEKRAAAVECVFRSLREGGYFAFWENNPWNPGTRYVMSRIPFDRDAITLTAPEARRLLRHGGFDIAGTDYLFIFPRVLRTLRPLEPLVSRVPLGAQYLILARKRSANAATLATG